MSKNLKVANSLLKAQIDTDIQLFPQAFVIVPYIPSGYIDLTNKGITTSPQNLNDHETFKRMWVGNDAFTITWKGSCNLIQDKETNEVKLDYQLGETLLGNIEDSESLNDIDTDQSFSEYKSQQVKGSISMRINSTRFNLNDNYLLYFYKIPELSGQQLYRIVSYEKEFIGNKLIAYIVDFENLNQTLSNTGRARSQNVMPSAPGQGYIECAIINEEDYDFTDKELDKDYYLQYGRVITADKTKLTNFNVVKKVVVKAFGACILSNISFFGRRVKVNGDFREYGEQRLIFPYNLSPVSTPTLFRSQQVENNFYWGEFSPTIMYWKELMTFIKEIITPISEWKYQGFITFMKDELYATNPTTKDKDTFFFPYNVFGSWSENIGGEPFLTKWSPTIQEKTFNTTACIGTEGSYKITNGNTIEDLMQHSYWVQKAMSSLPIGERNSLSFGSVLGYALGAAITGSIIAGGIIALIGIAGHVLQSWIQSNNTSFLGIAPASLVDLGISQFAQGGVDTRTKIGFDLFNSNSDNGPNSIFFSGSTMTTGFTAELTDELVSQRLPSKILNFGNVGQTKYKDGTFILDSKQPFLLNGDQRLSPMITQDEGFIIDSFNIQAIHNGEYSVEFLNNDNEVVWSSIFQSESKFTQSQREINTWRNTSIFNRENVFITNPIPYPQAPPTPTIYKYDIVNATYSFSTQLTNSDYIWKDLQDISRDKNTSKPNHFISYGDNPLAPGIQHIKLIGTTTNWAKHMGGNFYESIMEFPLFDYNDKINNINTFMNVYQNVEIKNLSHIVSNRYNINISSQTLTDLVKLDTDWVDFTKKDTLEYRFSDGLNLGDYSEYRMTICGNLHRLLDIHFKIKENEDNTGIVACIKMRVYYRLNDLDCFNLRMNHKMKHNNIWTFPPQWEFLNKTTFNLNLLPKI